MTRNLETVAAFADRGPFTAGQIRWFIFCAEQNGLAKAGAIVRVGRRVYIDTGKFDAWIDGQNPQAVAA
jgi:hypothetical protein